MQAGHSPAGPHGGPAAVLLLCLLLQAPAAAEAPLRCDSEPACAAALEPSVLAEHPAEARREGDTLVLQRGDAGPLRLTDGEPAGHVYRYLGPLMGTDLQLLLQRVEGQAPRYRLVGPGPVEPPLLDAPPWPSPGGRMLAVATLARGGQSGSVTLLHRVGARWQQLFRFESGSGMGFVVRSWRTDAASLRLDWHCGNASAGGSVQLRDGPYGWDWLSPPPARCP